MFRCAWTCNPFKPLRCLSRQQKTTCRMNPYKHVVVGLCACSRCRTALDIQVVDLALLLRQAASSRFSAFGVLLQKTRYINSLLLLSCLHQTSLAVVGIMFSSCTVVRSSQTCEHDILKTNEPILCQLTQGKGMKRSALGSGGQRSRSYDAEDRFGSLAEASFSTPWIE